jgi:hypothetical protein
VYLTLCLPSCPCRRLFDFMWLCIYYVGVRQALNPLLLFCTFHFFY